MRKMIRSCWMAFLILWATGMHARQSTSFQVAFDTVRHYVDVTMTVTDIDAETTVLKLPVWAPGYYLIVDFPKNVTDFAVTDAEGKPLSWEKRGKTEWVVGTAGQNTLRATYRVFANRRSVAESRVSAEAAFIAPNGVFMYVDGRKEEPVELGLDVPANWQHVSTGLKPLGDNRFYAVDYDRLYDSPLLLGNQQVVSFTHEGHAYEIAMETPDGVEETSFPEDVKRVISAATRLIGDVPYDNYCFILLGEGRGGLEHFNSQACYTDGSFRFASREQYLGFLTFIAHEYFHLYNVKTIRPIELGPFDYDKEVFTPLLWVSEGFTVYYESALLRAAGLADGDFVLGELSGYIRSVEPKDGHRHMSLRQSSYDIWLNFFNDNENGDDTRISYYNKGPILGLLMDIEIRRLTGNARSLDDVMRALYNVYYKQQDRGFTEEEFWQTCADVAGSELTEMRRYVDTTDEIDYDRCLAPAGLRLNRETWQLERLPQVDDRQQAIRASLIGDSYAQTLKTS